MGGKKTRIHVNVRGVVQAVGFRFFTRDLADELNLRGFVRNMPDGSVEAEVEGPQSSVRIFAEELRIGPVSAHVTGLEIKELPYEGLYDRFEIRY